MYIRRLRAIGSGACCDTDYRSAPQVVRYRGWPSAEYRYGDGIYRLTGGTFERYGKDEGLSDATVFSLVAENAGGLTLLRPKLVRQIGAPEGLPDTDANTVLEALDGSLWIGTQGRGINHYQNGRFAPTPRGTV